MIFECDGELQTCLNCQLPDCTRWHESKKVERKNTKSKTYQKKDRSDYYKKYYSRNRDKMLSERKDYYWANRERILAKTSKTVSEKHNANQ